MTAARPVERRTEPGRLLGACCRHPDAGCPPKRPDALRIRAGNIIGRLEREGRISAAQAREAQDRP